MEPGLSGQAYTGMQQQHPVTYEELRPSAAAQQQGSADDTSQQRVPAAVQPQQTQHPQEPSYPQQQQPGIAALQKPGPGCDATSHLNGNARSSSGLGTNVAASEPNTTPARVPLLPWEQQIMNEVMEQDALIITAAGLGWQRLVAVLLRIQHYQQRGCVLILGLYPWQRQVITQELARHDPQVPAPLDVNNEVPASERIEMYRSRAALCVTSRILVVDLLSARITPQQIAGILILNAHRITDTGGEAFAVRLFRAGGATARGWVRACTDTPTAFAGGFNKVEKVMRALQIRHVGLWPRFRHEVSVVMEAHTPQVVEWQQELPHNMLMIQAAVMEVADALLKELKRSHKVDVAGLTAEQLTARSLSEVVRRQLEPVWDTLSWRTRQLVKDLRTLRDISHHLTTCDAVTFLAYLESLRLSAGPRTVWLFHDAANTIYEQARRRVYLYRLPGSKSSTSPSKTRPSSGAAAADSTRKRKVGSGASSASGIAAAGAAAVGGIALAGAAPASVASTGSNTHGGLEPVLEEVPKWELLHKVLAEVQERRQALRNAQAGAAHPFPHPMGEPDVDAPAAGGAPAINRTTQPAAQQPGSIGRQMPQQRTSPAEVVVLSDSDDDVQFVRESHHQKSSSGHRTNTMAAGTSAMVHEAAKAKLTTGHDAAPAPPRASSILDESGAAACVAAGQAPVLIVSRELHSCGQLESVLRVGGKAIMQAAYEAYLLRMEAAKDSRRTRGAGTGRSGTAGTSWRGRGRGRGRGDAHLPEDFTATAGVVPAQMRPGEASALAAEANRVAQLRKGTDTGDAADAKHGRRMKRAKRDAPQASQPLPPDSAVAATTGDADAEAGSGGAVADAAAGLRDAAVARGRGRLGRRGRGRGRGSRPEQQGDEPAELHLRPTETVHAAAATRHESGWNGNPAGATTRTQHGSSAGSPAGAVPTSDGEQHAACPLLEGVHFVSLDAHQAEAQLWHLQPGTIIMYDPDLAFLRQVEVYAAAMPALQALQLQVHMLSYADSPEEAAFLAAVEKEVSVFSSLIEFKGHIAIPAAGPPALMNQLVPRGVSADEWLDVYQQNSLTRAGARAGNKGQPRRLVVDMREFMSSLPAVLYQQGFELVPVTLEVGDYVLSPDMCVERKAIPDLVSSLASGRLYSQAEAMVKHYKMPVLLIEFDSNKKFGLQPVNDLGEDIDPKAIGSRLVLLTLHFPKLRLVWSRSLHATADIFATLKSNQDEPDVAAAQVVGLPPEAQLLGGNAAGGADSGINTSAIELLKRLPGVTDTNARLITSSVQSLAELATLPLPRLEAIMCSQRNAHLLHDFLHAPCPKP